MYSILALALGLSACATISESEIKRSIFDETSRIEAPENWSQPSLSQADIANDWSEILTDDVLFGLIDEALNDNPSLQSVFESIKQSEALLKQARSAQGLNLGAIIRPSTSSPFKGGSITDFYSANLTASWEADLWNRISAGVQGAEYEVDSARQFYYGAKQSLIAQVARAYVFAIESKRQTILTRNSLKAQEETLRIVKIRYDAKTVSKREYVLAESDVYISRDNLEISLATETASIQALQILLGRYPDGKYNVPDKFPEISDVVAVGRPASLLRRRPDVIRSELLVYSAFSGEEVAKRSRWPSLSLSANTGSSVGNISDVLNPLDLALSLGATLADTLFDGGLSKGQIEAASAFKRGALKTYGQTVLDAFGDVEANLNNLNLIDVRYTNATKAAEAARETLRLAEIQYREGTLDLIDVITFRQRSLQTDQTLLSLERQKIEARIALFLALGGAVNE